MHTHFPKNIEFMNLHNMASFPLHLVFSKLFPARKTVFYFLCLCLGACGGEDIEVISPTVHYLAALEVEGLDFDTDFERETFGVYRLDVREDVDEVHIVASALADDVEIVVEVGNEKRFDTYEYGGVVDMVIAIEEGENSIRLILSEEGESETDDVETAYNINVYKVRSSASISNLALYDFIGSGEEVALSPSFSPNIFSYEVSVPFSTCAISSAALTARRESSLTINAENVDADTLYYYTLNEGENIFDIVATSENDLYSEHYTVYVERLSPSDSLQRSYASLQNVEFEGFDFDFVCGVNQYSLSLNNSVNSIPINVKPAVDGAKIYLNDREIKAEENFQYLVDDNSGVFTIAATSLDGQTTTEYTFNYTRYARNVVEVETVAELQSALKNAQPNDEIRIAEGTYQGTASVEASGLSTAHFYSDRSGTPNENIYLVADDQDVIITGEDASKNSVLTLAGNYWQISGFEITNAKHGLVIEDGSFNILRSLDINNIGQSAIALLNGSEHNTLALNLFSDIGQLNVETESAKLAAVVVGDDESTWGDGARLENSENVVRHNTFLSLGNARAVYIEEGSMNTRLEFNQFIEEKARGDRDRDALVINQGSDTLMRFNYFEYEIDKPVDSIVKLLSSTADADTTPWGENTVLYENAFDLYDKQIPLVSAENIVAAKLAENIRYDDQEAEYIGSGIDIDSTIVPIYQFQFAKDTDKCLGVEVVEASGNVEEYYRVMVKNCSAENDTFWKVSVDTGPYVRIESLGVDEDASMRTVSDFSEACAEGQNIVYLDEDIQGYSQRWLLDEIDGDIYVRSKKNLNFVLSIPGSTLSNDLTMATCALIGSDQQRFKLNRVN